MSLNDIITIFSFLLGLAIGSFLNVCIYRIPLKKSLIYPPSSCPQCGERIRFYDNIPIISYIVLSGRCRRCGKPISTGYPLVELIMGLLSLCLFVRYGLSHQYFLLLVFSASLIVISIIDLRHQIIPDIISIPGIVSGLLISIIFGDIKWHDSLIGAIAGGGILYIVAEVYFLLTGKEGMGGGDIKLLAMIGAWMGWKALPKIILISSFTGIIIGGTALVLTHKGMRARIPFGPFLVLGALAYLFFKQPIDAVFKYYFYF
ncbi:MAG TPA: prepilin peptidase [Desulfatiglandales bacterium]|nr:prepilin peptidase [Desulfatiglandales bacterium]